MIESSKLGTIGVGEGTTAVFRMMLKQFGFDEMAFLRETGATIKYGIRHRDWRRLGIPTTARSTTRIWWRATPIRGRFSTPISLSQGESVGETHLFQHLMRKARAPYARKGGQAGAGRAVPPRLSFRSGLAGQFLRRQAKGVTVIDDQVQGWSATRAATSPR